MKQGYIRGACFFILIFIAGFYLYSFTPPIQADGPQLSPQRLQHVLYGDRTGGGHLYGVGKPCKSEFPADWDAEEIETEVERIAANDNLPWKRQKNGYYTAEQMVEGVRVRVVLGRNKNSIITAYPTNVARNACTYD